MTSPSIPELCRVCILDHARAKANFSDNTVIVMNSTGSSFSITAPDGRSTRQVSEYALSRHCPLLATVLEFRNMHVEFPCFCKPLARGLRSGFTLGFVIRDATWPTPAQAISDGLAQLQPDDKITLSSEDGVAQLVLHRHQRRFAVCYPLLVAERPQEAQYEYVWQTQVFNVASHPARWQPAVRTVLLVASRLGKHGELCGAALSPPCSRPQIPPDPCTGKNFEYSVNNVDCKETSSREEPAARRSVLPRADDCIRSGLTEQLRTDGWWSETSLSLMPPDDLLLFEWTPHATCQYLPEIGEVEVWVHIDESCLVSTRGGKFLEHYRDADGTAQMYAATCVPDTVWSPDRTYRYPLASLAHHALKIRSHNATLTAAVTARVPTASVERLRGPGTRTTNDDLFAVMSTTIVEESVVPGHGQFTAYEDGRVRVCFDDRTILHMCALQSHCKLVLPDGSMVVVAVTNPVGVKSYVEAAREFAVWTFKSSDERAEELHMQARVRVELFNSQRMAQLCGYTSNGSLPRLPAPCTPGADMCTITETPTDRQALVDEMLSATARLLHNLQA